MKVLVVGGGGREHALVWKLAQSRRVKKLYCAPGNGGIAQLAELVDLSPEDPLALTKWAAEHRIDLTVVGPEGALAQGIVDEFTQRHLPIVGPTRQAAQLETSKAFAKEFCHRTKIATPRYAIFDQPEAAKAYIKEQGVPIVVKADGLCGGKGAIVATTMNEALGAVSLIMEDQIFGAAGRRIVIEEALTGDEVSILAICDGKTATILPSAQDHKRLLAGDKGPNTGGMGAYSPAPVLTEMMLTAITQHIIQPTLTGLTREGLPYCGILYAGLMLTSRGPMVLEFNARFGDPEAQTILPRLKTDLVTVLEASVNGTLEHLTLEWDPRPCVCVVAASGGYPGEYERGKPISGLEEAAQLPDVVIFHAGTKREGQRYFTWGGRVLNVVALGPTVEQAVKQAYQAMEHITFEGMQYRRDIAWRAVRRHARSRT